MPNDRETKPHVLTIRLDPTCDGCKGDDPEQWCSTRCMHYEVECPYADDEEARLGVCMSWTECRCNLTPPPFDEPRNVPVGMGGTGYAFGSDIIAVAAWVAYWDAYDDHADEHPHGWEPDGNCWVQTGDHCWPEPLDGVPNVPGTYEVSVDNEGHLEDSVLVLYPWREVASSGLKASNTA